MRQEFSELWDIVTPWPTMTAASRILLEAGMRRESIPLRAVGSAEDRAGDHVAHHPPARPAFAAIDGGCLDRHGCCPIVGSIQTSG